MDDGIRFPALFNKHLRQCLSGQPSGSSLVLLLVMVSSAFFAGCGILEALGQRGNSQDFDKRINQLEQENRELRQELDRLKRALEQAHATRDEAAHSRIDGVHARIDQVYQSVFIIIGILITALIAGCGFLWKQNREMRETIREMRETMKLMRESQGENWQAPPYRPD